MLGAWHGVAAVDPVRQKEPAGQTIFSAVEGQ
jgi:hypothetical protein